MSPHEQQGNGIFSELVRQMEQDPWQTLVDFLKQNLYWQRVQQEVEGKYVGSMLKALRQRNDLPPAVKAFFFKQSDLHIHYPWIYCTKDLRRAIRFELDGRSYIRCPVCLDTKDLIYPIRTVIGHIDPEAATKQEGETLHLSLWNASTRTPGLAEVDRIVAHPFKDANWAIAAVLEKYQNQYAFPKPRLEIEQGVELNHNTQILIQNF